MLVRFIVLARPGILPFSKSPPLLWAGHGNFFPLDIDFIVGIKTLDVLALYPISLAAFWSCINDYFDRGTCGVDETRAGQSARYMFATHRRIPAGVRSRFGLRIFAAPCDSGNAVYSCEERHCGSRCAT